jgi:hypothetical protein
MWPVVVPPYLLQASPAGFPFFKGRFVGGGSCRVSAFLVAAWILSGSRIITGTLYIAIIMPNKKLFIINALR